MPNAPLRPCATTGCPVLVKRGHCPTHMKQANQRRGSAHRRGYTAAWQRWRPVFIGMLLDRGILPVCGASLPEGPQTAHSRCRAQGLKNGEALHLNHHPPLTDAEREDPLAVMDPNRIELLCATCHNAETSRWQHTQSSKQDSGMNFGTGG